jgi:GNAT superfamily N-acetyltransferase
VTVLARADLMHLPVVRLSAAERAEILALGYHPQPASSPADWAVMVKVDRHVVTHMGILYRVIRVGETPMVVGGFTQVMTLEDWRGRGYARASLESAADFVRMMLAAPFALAICPLEAAAFYEHLGWQVHHAPITAEHSGRSTIMHDQVAATLDCQPGAVWPTGPIDLHGAPW